MTACSTCWRWMQWCPGNHSEKPFNQRQRHWPNSSTVSVNPQQVIHKSHRRTIRNLRTFRSGVVAGHCATQPPDIKSRFSRTTSTQGASMYIQQVIKSHDHHPQRKRLRQKRVIPAEKKRSHAPNHKLKQTKLTRNDTFR